MKNITGQKFGRLTVIRFSKKKNKRRYFWLCKCSCGKQKEILRESFITGKTKSCGCLVKEGCNRIHGMAEKNNVKRFYRIWLSLKARCNNKICPAYKLYGIRGIKCEWKSFIEFRDDMLESYEKHCKYFGEKQTTIDRIDNDGNYCKGNCRWATLKEQQNNKGNNYLITYKGRTQTLMQWSEELKIKRETISKRIKNGWGIEKSLILKPIIGRNQYSL